MISLLPGASPPPARFGLQVALLASAATVVDDEATEVPERL